MRFCEFPRPKRHTHDNDSELCGIEFQEILHSYDAQDCPTTAKNSQANVIAQRACLTMVGTLRMKTFEGNEWWFELTHTLQITSCAFRTTMPSEIPCNPGALA